MIRSRAPHMRRHSIRVDRSFISGSVTPARLLAGEQTCDSILYLLLV